MGARLRDRHPFVRCDQAETSAKSPIVCESRPPCHPHRDCLVHLSCVLRNTQPPARPPAELKLTLPDGRGHHPHQNYAGLSPHPCDGLDRRRSCSRVGTLQQSPARVIPDTHTFHSPKLTDTIRSGKKYQGPGLQQHGHESSEAQNVLSFAEELQQVSFFPTWAPLLVGLLLLMKNRKGRGHCYSFRKISPSCGFESKAIVLRRRRRYKVRSRSNKVMRRDDNETYIPPLQGTP